MADNVAWMVTWDDKRAVFTYYADAHAWYLRLHYAGFRVSIDKQEVPADTKRYSYRDWPSVSVY